MPATVASDLRMPAAAEPDQIRTSHDSRPLPPPSLSIPQPTAGVGLRSGHLNLDTFSPVNQNGSFEFDRVLKSGEVHKRTRKTKVILPGFGRQQPILISRSNGKPFT